MTRECPECGASLPTPGRGYFGPVYRCFTCDLYVAEVPAGVDLRVVDR